MRRIVFYSWQSDLPNSTNRGFIQRALETAAANITRDDTIVEPVIDRDTEGVAGSPDIASTIFAKIAAADVVVADVSIVSASSAKRPTPNPNVLIEIGYAIKALGFERVILTFNKAFGAIEGLPFDLRMRRLVVYEAQTEGQDKASIRSELTNKLEVAIRAALGAIPDAEPQAPSIASVDAIENQKPNRRIVIRADLANILSELDALNPTKTNTGVSLDEFMQAISKTQEPISIFSKMVEVVAVMNDVDSALEINRWFGALLERYALPKGFSGTYYRSGFDFYRFVGHELFVTLFAFLLREQCWELISRLLNEPVPVRYLRKNNGPGNADWSDLCQYVVVLGEEGLRRNQVSLHANILHERHTKGGLSAVLPFDDFAEADFFLYLRGLLPKDADSNGIAWKPWSALYLQGTPVFLLRAESRAHADIITRLLQLPSIDEFKKRLLARGARVGLLFRSGWWDYPVRQSDIEKIGSRQN